MGVGWFSHNRQDKKGVVEVDDSQDEEDENEEDEDDSDYAIHLIFNESDDTPDIILGGLTLSEAKKKMTAIQMAFKSSDLFYILYEQKETEYESYESIVLNIYAMRNKCVAIKIEHE